MAVRDVSTRPQDDPIDALVVAVLERLTTGERAALDEVCDANPAVADELRSRIAALGEMSLLPSDAAAMAFPERLGEFRLLRRLGGGGMGVVYEALQEPLDRTVALKLIRPEHLYFARSRERFQRETEAVARLAHPNIVSIYTVGEAQGTPYFAMEMIHGATLAQALEQVAGLAPESLVGADLRGAVLALASDDATRGAEHVPDLFAGTWAQACTRVIVHMTEALAHAHGRGVLHRDIKPSNIAITSQGRVVLLDFGLAGLETELRLTASGSALGSVLYMAPEQIAGRSHEIDARTDVYALGVTLYELLALQTPFAGADSEQTRAAILEGQPQALRARHRGVARDLEIVCLKAMERERSRRYSSMTAFGEDLRNVLEGRAIHARPPSAAYRARRWTARNPATTTAIVLSSLLITVLPSALFLQQRGSSRTLQAALDAQIRSSALAAEEGERANAKARDAEEVASFLVGLFGASDPYRSDRRDMSARELLDSGVERIDSDLSEQPQLQAQLLERIGESYTNLDLYEAALVPLDRALELRRELHGNDDLRTAATMLQVASAARLARRPGAIDLLREASAVLARNPNDNLPLQINARTLLATCLIDQGESVAPLELLGEARELLKSTADERRDLRWSVLAMLASAHERLAQHEEAEAVAREALELEPAFDDLINPWQLAVLDTLGRALYAQQRMEEAQRVYETLLPSAREFYPSDSVVRAHMELNACNVSVALGHTEGLADAMQHSCEVLRKGLGVENPQTVAALARLAESLLAEGRFDEASELLRDAADELRSRVGDEASGLMPLLFWIGVADLAQGDSAHAVEALRRARELVNVEEALTVAMVDATLARALLDDPSQRDSAAALARACLGATTRPTDAAALYVLARIALLDQHIDEAEAALRKALVVADFGSRWLQPACSVLLGELLVRRGDVNQGCPMLTGALAELERVLTPRHAEVLAARARLEASGASRRCAGEPAPTATDRR